MIETLVFIMLGCLIMACIDIVRLEIRVKDLQYSIRMHTDWIKAIQDIMLHDIKKENTDDQTT